MLSIKLSFILLAMMDVILNVYISLLHPPFIEEYLLLINWIVCKLLNGREYFLFTVFFICATTYNFLLRISWTDTCSEIKNADCICMCLYVVWLLKLGGKYK